MIWSIYINLDVENVWEKNVVMATACVLPLMVKGSSLLFYFGLTYSIQIKDLYQ